MSSFRRGKTYTRGEIHDAVGGGLQDYLPHRGGKVIAACLNPDLNPEAPEIVLPGSGPAIKRWAHVFAEQVAAVPTFLKRKTNNWEYVGDYCVRRLSTESSDLTAHRSRAGRDDVSMVLFLESAD